MKWALMLTKVVLPRLGSRKATIPQVALLLSSLAGGAFAQGTAFTYQGLLNESGRPATGTYDFTFTLYSGSSGGAAVASPMSTDGVGVTNGVFSVTIDFGSSPWTGQANWLQIAVATNGNDTFTTLAPRQPVTPAPYAIAAENVTGVVPLGMLPATVLTNRETGVVFSDLNINGTLSLSGQASVDAGGNGHFTGLSVDTSGENAGTVSSNALIFGNVSGATGEGLASKRNGTNPYDLEFFTEFTPRLVILNNGNVGINTTTPGETLEINGPSRLDNNDVYLRAAGDENHGLGYREYLGSIYNDGPFLYGFNAGVLGAAPGIVTLQWTWEGNVWVSNNISATSLTVDRAGLNIGNVHSNALTFGVSSGEGMASKRSGTNPYDLEFYTDFSQRMVILNNGHVGIGNSDPGDLLVVGNAASPAYCDGANWVNASDRNSKEDFAAINPRDVLQKVSSLPITEWQYKVDAKGLRHLGPMAQDFHAAFGLNGGDDKHISTVDEGGVALAAIQGLNQKLETAVREKDAEIEGLKARLEKLERLLAERSAGGR